MLVARRVCVSEEAKKKSFAMEMSHTEIQVSKSKAKKEKEMRRSEKEYKIGVVPSVRTDLALGETSRAIASSSGSGLDGERREPEGDRYHEHWS